MKFIDIKTKDSSPSETPQEEPKTTEEKREKTVNSESTTSFQTNTESGITPSAKQFPISSEKTMTYNSSR